MNRHDAARHQPADSRPMLVRRWLVVTVTSSAPAAQAAPPSDGFISGLPSDGSVRPTIRMYAMYRVCAFVEKAGRAGHTHTHSWLDDLLDDHRCAPEAVVYVASDELRECQGCKGGLALGRSSIARFQVWQALGMSSMASAAWWVCATAHLDDWHLAD